MKFHLFMSNFWYFVYSGPNVATRLLIIIITTRTMIESGDCDEICRNLIWRTHFKKRKKNNYKGHWLLPRPNIIHQTLGPTTLGVLCL